MSRDGRGRRLRTERGGVADCGVLAAGLGIEILGGGLRIAGLWIGFLCAEWWVAGCKGISSRFARGRVGSVRAAEQVYP